MPDSAQVATPAADAAVADTANLPAILTVVGEALIDLVPDGPPGSYNARPGGSPFNVAIGLARLGHRTSLMARFADNAFGRLLREHARAEGVDLAHAARATEPTTLAAVSIHGDAQASYDFYYAGTADWQWTEQETALLPAGTALLHLGSLAALLPPGAPRLHELARNASATATITYDPNIRAAVLETLPDARRNVEALIALADVVKISEVDLSWLRPDQSPEKFALEQAQTGSCLAVVTLGEHGAIAAAPGVGPQHFPAHSVEVVDTVGAGDSYMSALISGLAERALLGADRRPALLGIDADTIREVLDRASRAAAITCGRQGSDPPTRAELDGRA